MDTEPRPTKQVIVMRKDLNMRKGKIAAQAAHASMAFLSRRWRIEELDYEDYEYCDEEDRYHNVGLGLTPVEKLWFDTSFVKICVSVDSEEALRHIEAQASLSGITCHLITDNGRTEFHGVPTPTCLALGPDYSDRIDTITRDLPLL